MQLPASLEPYLYRAQFSRAVDGSTVLLHVDLGFGIWKLAAKFPGGSDAKHPQGRYRLNGLRVPEVGTPGGREVLERLKELTSLAERPDHVLVRTVKHPRLQFLVDLYIRAVSSRRDPFTDGTLDVEDEQGAWLEDVDLLGLIAQTAKGQNSTVRALATEVLWRRRQLSGGGSVIHVNQQLLDEGLAQPYGSKS